MNTRTSMNARLGLESRVARSKLSEQAVLSINKILDIEEEFPGLVQVEMLDHFQPLIDSARVGKYPLNNWLEPNGRKCEAKVNLKSIQNHVDQEHEGIDRDIESGLPPRLHASCRLMMKHVRNKRGIVHEND